jgi:hypothetical protein
MQRTEGISRLESNLKFRGNNSHDDVCTIDQKQKGKENMDMTQTQNKIRVRTRWVPE